MVCALGNKVADFTACDRLGPAQLNAILPALGPPRRRRAAALPHAASLPLGSEEEEEEAAAGAEVEDADAGASSQAEAADGAEEEVLRDSLLREVRAAKAGSAEQRQLMARWNSEVPVNNARRFPPPPPGALPIVLLVYERRSYLEVALRLLSLCRGVNATTLVVSHQGTQRNVWQLVSSIGFARVRQLLYPLADHPKLRGALALKLHFTWALARAFALLEADEIVYMEDDFWPTPDFYASALRLRAARELHCPRCAGSVLGDHPRDWHERHRDGAHWLDPATRALLHRPYVGCNYNYNSNPSPKPNPNSSSNPNPSPNLAPLYDSNLSPSPDSNPNPNQVQLQLTRRDDTAVKGVVRHPAERRRLLRPRGARVRRCDSRAAERAARRHSHRRRRWSAGLKSPASGARARMAHQLLPALRARWPLRRALLPARDGARLR